jgi:uncharacterized membrane protein
MSEIPGDKEAAAMSEKKSSTGSKILKKLRGQFIMGLVLVVPLGVTAWILVWIFHGIDNILGQYIEKLWGHYYTGIGFGVMVVLVYLIGLLASNFAGRRLIRFGESLLARVPVVRPLYNGMKQILESFSSPGKTGFMQVVLVEYPRKGIKAIGFVTNELTDSSGQKLINVFIPTSPNPTTGFLQIVREEEITRTRLSVDDAIKMVVSVGRTTPERAGEKLSAGASGGNAASGVAE